MDPEDETAGIQSRLRNLGFYSGEIDGEEGPEYRAAVKRFQEEYELEVTRKLNEETKDEVMKWHGE